MKVCVFHRQVVAVSEASLISHSRRSDSKSVDEVHEPIELLSFLHL